MSLPLGHVRSHKKFGSDRTRRFDVYWIQTDNQTNKRDKREASVPLTNKLERHSLVKIKLK